MARGDAKTGGARVKDCLEDHREEPGFSAECKEEFEAMMEARAADFRLDSTLREVRAPRPRQSQNRMLTGCICPEI